MSVCATIAPQQLTRYKKTINRLEVRCLLRPGLMLRTEKQIDYQTNRQIVSQDHKRSISDLSKRPHANHEGFISSED